MQSILITLTSVGAGNPGPFDLYTDADGYTTAIETGVTKANLLSGYYSVLVPDGATIIRVTSTGSPCSNSINLGITGLTTTTTTSSTTTSSSTTTTTLPTYYYYDADYWVDCSGVTTSGVVVRSTVPLTLAWTRVGPTPPGANYLNILGTSASTSYTYESDTTENATCGY